MFDVLKACSRPEEDGWADLKAEGCSFKLVLADSAQRREIISLLEQI